MRSANHLNVGAGLGTNVDTAFSNIAEPVEQCSSQLRALTEMIVSSKEDIDPEFMRKCRAEILSISTEVTSVCDECDQAKAVSRCFQLENDQDFASDMTIETGSTRAEKLKLALVNRMKSINPADSRLKLVAELTAALDEENEDDEIQIQRTQETGNDYICQVSQMRMKQPMKNTATQGGCKHRMDSDSLRLVLGNSRQGKCPIPGCRGIWRVGEVTLDTAFAAKMERYFRLQSQTQQEESSLSSHSFI